ncbi:hypothetical protein SAMN04488511_11950 [Pedobacter suwonensis]|uniref:Uncharacterized protein n=1 Tax=Pedobacter suwonensis TaxID=332999 RepID=A0A1I0U5H6_9SPHI|nr:hypothetical protein [Pedobacter suwonensis]SFA58436.1 hypothetical protein SAMN04488511_11950 [Pedobacter suwonensis]
MYKLIKLLIDWKSFQSEILSAIEIGVKLANQQIKTEAELELVETNYLEWNTKTKEFLKSSFEGEFNRYQIEFHNSAAGDYSFSGQNNLRGQFEKITGRLGSQLSYLRQMLKVLSVCDVIIAPNEISLEERSSYTTNQKLNFILNVLYDLYDDSYYSIEELFVGNGIPMKRYDQAREIINVLKDHGYVEVLGGIGTDLMAQITATGALAIEQTRTSIPQDYETMRYTPEQLNAKIDQLIEMLNRQGVGQEVLFDEMQDMKQLYVKLNKKDFGQIVKGKLIDLVIGKMVENDTISYVYESLTHHKLQLPSLF